MTPDPICPECRQPFPRSTGPGRPRRFCSDAHRLAFAKRADRRRHGVRARRSPGCPHRLAYDVACQACGRKITRTGQREPLASWKASKPTTLPTTWNGHPIERQAVVDGRRARDLPEKGLHRNAFKPRTEAQRQQLAASMRASWARRRLAEAATT